MEEFIEKLHEFKNWLYDEEHYSEAYSEKEKILKSVIGKFEECGLDKAF